MSGKFHDLEIEILAICDLKSILQGLVLHVTVTSHMNDQINNGMHNG